MSVRQSLVSLLVGLCFTITACASSPSVESKQGKTTFYLVRHAEKEKSDSSDPQLTAKGKARAQNLVTFLSNEAIDAVYSTDTTRTRDTASPMAAKYGLDLNLYSPRDIDYADFIKQNIGKTVVVVGHSNTTPGFANGLIGENKYADLSEDQYDHVFVVDIVEGNASSKVLLLKIGNEEKTRRRKCQLTKR